MIGKRRLDRALARMAEATPERRARVRWRVFQLNPNMAAGGMDRSAYLAAKFGSAERAAEVYRVIGREGRGEGIDFAFDRIRRTPNTLMAHGLIRQAQAAGLASIAVERLFAAYFTQGRDIGDREVLTKLAADIGLDADSVASCLSGDGADALRAEDAAARQRGITGVPFFLIDGRYSLAGAVAPEAIVRALELAAESVP